MREDEKVRVETVWSGNHYDPDNGSLKARNLHLFRGTDYGCEVRSRFWLYHVPDEVGAGIRQH